MAPTATRPSSTAASDAVVTLVEGYVPVIDLSSARGGGAEARLSVARALGEVCETSGFLAVVGHGVPADTITEMYRATREFFALPNALKTVLASSADDPLMRGFGRQGSLAASNPDASVAEDQPGPRLEQLLDRAETAGQGHEAVGQPGHLVLALVHRADDFELGQRQVGDVGVHQGLRDHPGDPAAGGEHGVGEDAHQAHAAAAVDDLGAGRHQVAGEELGLLGEAGIVAEGRSGVDGDRQAGHGLTRPWAS